MPDESSKFCGIIGTAYCGSTMFSYILGSSPDIFSTGELTLGFERYRCSDFWHGGDWTNSDTSSKGKEMGSEERIPCRFWTEDFAISLRDAGPKNRNRLLKERAYKILDKKIVLNPDKAPKWYKKSLKAGDDLDYLIILFKKPEAYCFSFEVHKRKQGGKWENKSRMDRIDAACDIYSMFYSQAFEIIEKYDIPVIFLSYEDFATDPQNKAKLICEKLGATFQEDMINYWDHKDRLHLTPSGNRGAHRQFLKKSEYIEYWENRLKSDSKDRSYFGEHANWFLDNYHKITLDEKYKKHLLEEEKERIINDERVSELYNKMMALRI